MKDIRMNISKVYASIGTMLLFTFLLSACAGKPVESQSINEPNIAPVVAQVSDPVAEPTSTAEPDPTAVPTPTVEIEPEIIDLGHDAWLLVRELPDDVTFDANINLAFKDDIPDSRNFDYVSSEIAVVHLTQNNEPVTIDNGIVELCFTTLPVPGTNEIPAPYYWDTSQTPLRDGRTLRVSTLEKEPNLVVCMMVETSGAFGLIAR